MATYQKYPEFPGVTPRGNRIQVHFTLFPGVNPTPRKEPIYFEPTKDNQRSAYIKLCEIVAKCKTHTYYYEDYKRDFPTSKWPDGDGKGLLKMNKSAHTINEALDRWRDSLDKELSIDTVRMYMQPVDMFYRPMLGDMMVVDVTSAHIRDVLDAMKAHGWSDKTISTRMTPLKGAMEPYRGWFSYWPWADIKQGKGRKKRKPIYQPSEIKQFIDTATGVYKSMAIIGFGTGMRVSELRGLAVEDYLPGERKLWVRRKIESGKVGPTKNDKEGDSTRLIDLTPFPEVEQAIVERIASGDHLLWPTHEGKVVRLLFPDPRAKTPRPFMRSLPVCQAWKKICEKADIEYRVPGCMRHTFISIQLAMGADEAWVMKVVGHTTTTMIRENYQRVSEEAAILANRGAKSLTEMTGQCVAGAKD